MTPGIIAAGSPSYLYTGAWATDTNTILITGFFQLT
jgi:hypothetical protein